MSAPGQEVLISNPHETYQANIIACAAISFAIGAIFVALRFYTRGCLIHVLGAEDWVILVSLVFAGATCAGMIEQAYYGLGKHALDIEPKLYMPMTRAGWYTVLWYMITLFFTKISILLLYIRILSYQHSRYAAYAIMTLVVLTNIWTFITVMTSCIPLQAFWDHSIKDAYCRTVSYWFANTGMHMGTDFLIFMLPMPVIFQLQVRRRQKIVLYSIFAVGFLVCLISVLRLIQLMDEFTPGHADFTFDNVSISYFTCIEVNAAIACACAMTLKPLANRLFPRLMLGHSGGNAGSSPSPRPRGYHPHPDSPAARIRMMEEARDGRDGGRASVLTIGSKPSRAFLGRRGDGGDVSWMGPLRGGDGSVVVEEDMEALVDRQLKELEGQMSPGLEMPGDAKLKETQV